MTDVKISALPLASTPLAGTEVLPIVQSATTDQVSVANLTAGRSVSAASLTLTTTPLAVGSGGTGLTSLTAGYIPYASSSSALSFSSNLYSTGVNIGIGTAIPATTFNVVGNAFFDGTTRVRQSGSTRYRSDWRMSAGEASVNAYDDTGGVYIPYKLEASTFSVYTGTGASNPMVLNSSGNLGVGTTTPALKFVVSNGGAQGLEIDPTAVASAPVLLSYNRSGASFVALSFRASNFAWYDAANNQAMTLDVNGNFLIGATSTIASNKVVIQKANDAQLLLDATSSGSGVYTTISFSNQQTVKTQIYWESTSSRFYVQNGTGGVYVAQNGTVWTSTSDERLKDIIEPIENAIDKVLSLRTVIGKYKADITNKRRAFLIAQDVQSVLPEAVDSTNTDELGLQYTDIIPLALAAIKELAAKVAELEAKI